MIKEFKKMWRQDIDSFLHKRETITESHEGLGKFKPRGDFIHNHTEEIEGKKVEIPWKYGKVGIVVTRKKHTYWYWHFTNKILFVWWKFLTNN